MIINKVSFNKDGINILPGEVVLIVSTCSHTPNIRFGIYLGMSNKSVVVECQSKRWIYKKDKDDYECQNVLVKCKLQLNRIWSINHFNQYKELFISPLDTSNPDKDITS
jgi:hypothetical protein